MEVVFPMPPQHAIQMEVSGMKPSHVYMIIIALVLIVILNIVLINKIESISSMQEQVWSQIISVNDYLNNIANKIN